MRLTPPVQTACAAICLLVALPPPSTAQVYVSIGTRAQGMAGAFVAVADDATATWWNPAGLATGAFFSLILEQGRVDDPLSVPDAPAIRARSGGFAIAFPALGLSYYRFRIEEAGPLPAIAEVPPNRQDEEAGVTGIRGVAVSQYGITVGQSLSDALVVASTVKLLRGGQIQAHGAPGGLQAAGDLDVPVSTRIDLDLGVMASLVPVRLGATLKNVTTPEFGDSAGTLRLNRQARVGVAVLPEGLPWPLTVAADVDLTEASTVLGDIRHAATGVEGWLWDRRLGVRGGLSVNTTGTRGESASGGLSLLLRPGMHVVGAITRGSDRSREGWSAGVVVTF